MQPRPHAGIGPLRQTSPAGHARTEPQLLREVFPRDPGVQDEQDALEYQPVRVTPPTRMTSTSLHPRQERFDHRPEFIVHFPRLPPSHPHPPDPHPQSHPTSTKIISLGVVKQPAPSPAANATPPPAFPDARSGRRHCRAGSAGLGIPTDAEARMRSGCTQSAGNRSWPTHPYRRELIMNLAGPVPRCIPKVKPESTAVPDGQTAPINVAGTKHRDGRGSQKNTPMQRRTPSHKELARTAASFRACIGAAALRRARATRAGRLVPAAAPVLRQVG